MALELRNKVVETSAKFMGALLAEKKSDLVCTAPVL